MVAHVILLSPSQKLSMKDALHHPLGPRTWPLATNDGLLRKTSKAVLRQELKNNLSRLKKYLHLPHALLIAWLLFQMLTWTT